MTAERDALRAQVDDLQRRLQFWSGVRQGAAWLALGAMWVTDYGYDWWVKGVPVWAYVIIAATALDASKDFALSMMARAFGLRDGNGNGRTSSNAPKNN